MKFFAAVFLALIAVALAREFTKEEKESFYKHAKECKDLTGIDEAMVDGIYTVEVFPEYSEKLGKYLFCLNKKFNFQNEDGDFDTTALINGIGSGTTESTDKIKKCTIKEGTGEESAYKSAKCLHDLKKAHH